MFRRERAVRRAAATFLAVSCVPLGWGLRAGAVEHLSDATDLAVPLQASGTAFTAPADGRLRGEDFAATVTGVAWPDQAVFGGKSEEPVTGRRFIEFNLTLAENVNSITPAGTDPAVTAAVEWDGVPHPLSLTELDNTIAQQSAGPNWPSASGQFIATVPNDTHVVDLILSQGSFSQGFNLWTLRRIAPAPVVLYRDPTLPTLSTTSGASATLALSNPSDGFSDTAQVTVQSATLSFFQPSGTGNAPGSPGQAVLSVVLDGEYPYNPNDLTESGHYLGSQAPLPGDLLSFTPNGATPIPAIMSDAGDTTGKGQADNGLFDATYSFVVPGTLAGGTITVDAGSFGGAEFTLFTPENTNIDITAPANLAITFPAVPATAVQREPPWVGRPLPHTALASSGSGLAATPSHPLPIWLAVVVLVALAAGVIVVQRQRKRRRALPATDVIAQVVGAPGVPTQPADTGTDRSPVLADPPVAEAASEPAPAATSASTFTMSELMARVLGPPDGVGWRQVPDRRIVTEIVCWMVFHNRHLHSADEILVGVYSTEGTRREVNRETFFTYLSKVRQCVGPEHLPDATETGGYGLIGVTSDWESFQGLSGQADLTDGPEAIELRTRTLALVRGVPFQGVPTGHYGWAFEEQLGQQMISAVVTCAIRLANDLFDLGRYVELDEAVRAGLRADPRDTYLLEIQARAANVRNEGLARPGRSRGDTGGAEEAPGAGGTPDDPHNPGSGT
jgi:hypothetical protein